jgi:hypothetical protein
MQSLSLLADEQEATRPPDNGDIDAEKGSGTEGPPTTRNDRKPPTSRRTVNE